MCTVYYGCIADSVIGLRVSACCVHPNVSHFSLSVGSEFVLLCDERANCAVCSLQVPGIEEPPPLPPFRSKVGYCGHQLE